MADQETQKHASKPERGHKVLIEPSCELGGIRIDPRASFEGEPDGLTEMRQYLVGYGFLIVMGVIVLTSHLMTFFISFLFLYLISDVMTNDVRRLLPFIPKGLLFSVLYVSVALLITIITYKIIPGLVRNFPEIASQLQVILINQLKDANRRWNLASYVDIEWLRTSLKSGITSSLNYMMNSISPVYKGFVQFIFALVINLFLYYESDRVKQALTRRPGSLMSFFYYFLTTRWETFYCYFKSVMGGQIIISAINTVISTPVILLLGLPHPLLMIFVVFSCGLFPVVGNLLSNGVLVINALVSLGIWATGICFVLLIVIHKLEYFLNSRIIGAIVRLPVTISLASLVICEVVFGIAGLILAIPFVLFLRHELEHLPGPRAGNPLGAVIDGSAGP